MKEKIKVLIATILVAIIVLTIILLCRNKKIDELKVVNSNQELLKRYEYTEDGINDNLLLQIATLPFSLLMRDRGVLLKQTLMENNDFLLSDSAITNNIVSSNTIQKDYSKTNIQVENVDEADITKTDGDYIYSIANETDIVITDVKNPNEIKIASKIESKDEIIPNDMILYKDFLVVIYSKLWRPNKYEFNTVIKIYDIKDRENPICIKECEIYEEYYTSRCIGNMIYVISEGNLRIEGEDEIIAYYKEDGEKKYMGYSSFRYLNDIMTRNQTMILAIDLNDQAAKLNLKSYLIDISNAYVSENSIYILNQDYDYKNNVPPISTLFGIKGALGPFMYEQEYKDNVFTEIYKFDIKQNGELEYKAKTKVAGKTINQYSLDEINNHLRIALYDNEGTRIIIFDENLKQIGITENLAKGERMYASRFIGDKAYLVTYKSIDPLFTIDLSDEAHPKVLGELKIPGYSTYLHPYDENHLIGIGMETKEVIRRNSYRKGNWNIHTSCRNENGII